MPPRRGSFLSARCSQETDSNHPDRATLSPTSWGWAAAAAVAAASLSSTWVSQTICALVRSNQPLSPCNLSTPCQLQVVHHACNLVELPGHQFYHSFKQIWQFCAAINCRMAKRTAATRPHLIPHMCHSPREQWINMWQRRHGSLAFCSQGKTIPTGSWTGSPSGDQLLRRALYKLQQAAACSLGRCSIGLCEQEPAWSSRHKLFLMSKLLLMTQLTSWGLLRSS